MEEKLLLNKVHVVLLDMLISVIMIVAQLNLIRIAVIKIILILRVSLTQVLFKRVIMLIRFAEFLETANN